MEELSVNMGKGCNLYDIHTPPYKPVIFVSKALIFFEYLYGMGEQCVQRFSCCHGNATVAS